MQGSHATGKTGKSREFYLNISRLWKSREYSIFSLIVGNKSGIYLHCKHPLSLTDKTLDSNDRACHIGTERSVRGHDISEVQSQCKLVSDWLWIGLAW